MTFFPEIDTNKTKANAKRKLREYPRWRRVAGDVASQKITASYTLELKQTPASPSKTVERLALNRVSAEQELDAIRWTVSNLFDPVHRVILIEKYLNEHRKSDFEIYSELNISETTYYENLENALLAFAELYRNSELVIIDGELTE